MTEIYKIMTTETDSDIRRKAWAASKEVGPVIIGDFLRLVRMRNQLAQQAGFPNYHTYSLFVHEQSVEAIDAIFEELDQLTAGPFGALKSELDTLLAADYGIGIEDLRPWHYHDPFFQRTPLVYEVDLDQYYAAHDVAQLAIDYYAGIGMEVDDIMARSDLYDKPGKNPHAFATDIDRQGDVRILANIANDERWMETTLHELGHAVYFKYHDRDEPYLLREPAHSFTTEAAAMFFGRLSRNAAWMDAMLGLSDAQWAELETVTDKYLQFQQLLFARWALVMYNFEKALYANPDRDLNTLWWDMVERYQYVRRPESEPDAGWVSKLHFTQAPCYYHNYMLGELLASQWHYYLTENVLSDEDAEAGYVGQPRVGAYFKGQVFGPGAVYHWNEMIRRSTGRPLSADAFIEQFVR
jgi:peptidyl-dipeptidase A